ncbi:MAG: carbon storage regulator [Planctomycetaceae bacterium]|nr:carbon storage regulator [Planctomycetaceae bacterium]
MLVLSRKVGQSLVIAEGVTVTVSEIGPDYVRLTVEAPNEADVRRRYQQALDVPDDGGPRHERPIVVTLTLHEGALLDRLRRRMSGEEALPPSRDAALGALLQAVAEADDFELPRLAAAEPAVKSAPPEPTGPRRRTAAAGGKPR